MGSNLLWTILKLRVSKDKIHILCIWNSGAADHHPQLLQILRAINYIGVTEQDTGAGGGYEKHESDILGQSAESLFIKIR